MSWRAAVTTEEGMKPTQTNAKLFRRMDLRNQTSQSLCQDVTEKAEREAPMEGSTARDIRICIQMWRLQWEVGAMEKSSKFIPLHPCLRSHKVGNWTVRKDDYFGRCL